MDQTENEVTSPEAAPTIETNERFKWYAVMTQSGMEKKSTAVLAERIKKMNLAHLFGRIVIPTQQVEKIDDKGKKKIVEQKMMPGYIFIHMEMTDPAFHCVKDTPKISNFLGATQNRMPPPVGDDEVDRIINRAAHVAKEIASRPKMSFEKGEKVRVIDGPFTNFVGDVDEIKPDKQKLKLLISVFGRATPVEIEFSKVEKIVEGAQ